jgi:hypothetical protein
MESINGYYPAATARDSATVARLVRKAYRLHPARTSTDTVGLASVCFALEYLLDEGCTTPADDLAILSCLKTVENFPHYCERKS